MATEEIPPDVADEDDPALLALTGSMPVSIDRLERSMSKLMETPGALEDAGEALTFDSLSIVEDLPGKESALIHSKVEGVGSACGRPALETVSVQGEIQSPLSLPLLQPRSLSRRLLRCS